MKKSYTYEYCYQILGLKSGCTWKELRQTYKKSIQTWHPDRYDEGTKEKIAANEKIKMINIAYNQVFRYYKEKGQLPSIAPKRLERKQASKSRQNKTESREDLTERKEFKNRPQNLKKKRKLPLVKSIISITVVIGAYYLFTDGTTTQIPETPFTKNSESIEPELNKNKSHNQRQSDILFKKNDADVSRTDEHNYFTTGSGISDVINAQGIPTNTEGNIWYYNKAEVHFSEGKVTHWVRGKDTQLKVRLEYNHPK